MYVTVLRSRLDPTKLLVLALVTRLGVRAMESYEVPDDKDIVDALIERLAWLESYTKIPFYLQNCKRCSCCGGLVVGFDSPDLR